MLGHIAADYEMYKRTISCRELSRGVPLICCVIGNQCKVNVVKFNNFHAYDNEELG